MSLATRCVNCGTVFRVVQDQLKISEGWVRCGRCDEVFNAVEALFDLEREAPPSWKPPPAPPSPSAATVTANFQPQEDPPDDDEVFQLSDGDRVHSRFFSPEQDHVDHSPAENVDERDRVEFADAQFNMALLADGDEPLESEVQGTGIKRSSVRKARKQQDATKRGPDFVQQAAKRERWRSPAMRAGLSAATAVLVLLLAGQWLFHFRDLASAQWPSVQPLLARGCAWLNCQVGAPRRIDDVAVESSSLSPGPSNQGYRLSVVLRNRGHLPLTMPWVDLVLTDPTGQLVSRKALGPADFRVEPGVIAPSSEISVQALLASSDPRRISGYTVEIFYP